MGPHSSNLRCSRVDCTVTRDSGDVQPSKLQQGAQCGAGPGERHVSVFAHIQACAHVYARELPRDNTQGWS